MQALASDCSGVLPFAHLFFITNNVSGIFTGNTEIDWNIKPPIINTSELPLKYPDPPLRDVS